MKAIVKVFSESEIEEFYHGFPGWACGMTNMMGEEIVIKANGTDNDGKQMYEGGEWHWKEKWLEFKKEDKTMKSEKIEKLETDIKATKESLKKWKINVAILEDGTTQGVETGAQSCPLCRLYNTRGIGDRCSTECPIGIRTNRSGCAGTPYDGISNYLHKNDVERMAESARNEVLFLKEILCDLHLQLALEKTRIDRPPYHTDFEFAPIYKNIGISKFVKVCVQSKRSLKDGAGNTETVVVDDIDECQDDDDKYEGKVFYEIGLVDEDDEHDVITSFPTIKDAITYAGKFGCDVGDELRKLEEKK
jgi:hypothetical protein